MSSADPRQRSLGTLLDGLEYLVTTALKDGHVEAAKLVLNTLYMLTEAQEENGRAVCGGDPFHALERDAQVVARSIKACLLSLMEEARAANLAEIAGSLELVIEVADIEITRVSRLN